MSPPGPLRGFGGFFSFRGGSVNYDAFLLLAFVFDLADAQLDLLVEPIIGIAPRRR